MPPAAERLAHELSSATPMQSSEGESGITSVLQAPRCVYIQPQYKTPTSPPQRTVPASPVVHQAVSTRNPMPPVCPGLTGGFNLNPACWLILPRKFKGQVSTGTGHTAQGVRWGADNAGGSGGLEPWHPRNPPAEWGRDTVAMWRVRGSLDPDWIGPSHSLPTTTLPSRPWSSLPPNQTLPNPRHPALLSPSNFQGHLCKVCRHVSAWHPMPLLIPACLVMLQADISGPFTWAPPPLPQSPQLGVLH